MVFVSFRILKMALAFVLGNNVDKKIIGISMKMV